MTAHEVFDLNKLIAERSIKELTAKYRQFLASGAGDDARKWIRIEHQKNKAKK